MRSSFGKSVISLLFLSVFLLLRVTNAHAFEHFSDDTDEVHCELCDIITVSQQLTPFADTAQEETQIVPPVLFRTSELNSEYNEPLNRIVSPLSVYNKPPPFIIE